MAHGAVARIASISKAHPCTGASSPAKVPLHDRPCADRPRGPQRFPTRTAPSLMTALRDACGWTPWTILCRLTGTTGFFQSVLVAMAQIAATLAPILSAAHIADQRSRTRFRDLWVDVVTVRPLTSADGADTVTVTATTQSGAVSGYEICLHSGVGRWSALC
jgi:hypothetical protein